MGEQAEPRPSGAVKAEGAAVPVFQVAAGSKRKDFGFFAGRCSTPCGTMRNFAIEIDHAIRNIPLASGRARPEIARFGRVRMPPEDALEFNHVHLLRVEFAGDFRPPIL